MPVIRWDADLDNVDLSDQTMLSSGVSAYSNLNLSDVNASYCGVYICSAMDRYTGLPTTGNASVVVNIGKLFVIPYQLVLCI